MISAARSRWEVLGSGRCWAILLLHANEVVSSDRLIDELWGDRAPATAAKTIQVYVSKLRRALGDGWWLRARAGYFRDPATHKLLRLPTARHSVGQHPANHSRGRIIP